MKSSEYRQIIRGISRVAINKSFPGLKNKQLTECINLIAKNIHARMYGANVDNVESPIWRHVCIDGQPNVDALELLEQEME